MQQVGVATGHQQRHTLGQRPVLVHVGRQVAAQMVDGVERHAPGGRIRLGRSHSHQQGARQARPDGGRDNVGLLQAGGVQCAAHRRPERLQVCARSDLGHDTAVPDVFVDAGGHLVGQ